MRAPTLALALLATSCGSVTEMVLVVDTDIAEADSFRVTAVHPDGQSDSSSADLATRAPPRTLVLLHRGGPLGPVQLTIEAMRDGAPLVSVVREVVFQEGRSLRLDVFLAGRCRDARCDAGDTCGNDGECRSSLVPACEYEGTCAMRDGGEIDADASRAPRERMRDALQSPDVAQPNECAFTTLGAIATVAPPAIPAVPRP